jgi:hypothetical protein
MKEPTLEEVLEEIFDSKLASVYTALPGKVTRYYSEKQTADVQLQIKDHDIDEDGRPVFKSYPVLPNVPIAFPRGGDFFMSFPMSPGDYVLIVFCRSAIDQWRAKGVETAPGDLRHHSLTGAVAYPGLYPRTRNLTDNSEENLVIGKEEGLTVHLTDEEMHVGGAGAASDSAALASKVNTLINDLATAIAGWVVVPADGGAALKTALTDWLAEATTADVSSEILKVDE